MSSGLEYALNAAAWYTLGLGTIMTYHQVRQWLVKRRGDELLPPVSFGAYAMTMFVLMAVISGTLGWSNRLRSDRQVSCLVDVVTSDFATQNARGKLASAVSHAQKGFYQDIVDVILHPTDPHDKKAQKKVSNKFRTDAEKVIAAQDKADNARENPLRTGRECL